MAEELYKRLPEKVKRMLFLRVFHLGGHAPLKLGSLVRESLTHLREVVQRRLIVNAGQAAADGAEVEHIVLTGACDIFQGIR